VADQAVLPPARRAERAGGDTETVDPDEADDLTSLRAILVGPAEQKIQALQARIDDRFAQARDVGAVLPQALLHRASDPELARALTPPVERAITASVRRDPRPLADALFPVIGPAIRKAVAASLASMVESLNRTLEHSVSVRALQWRFEALRTGKSFGEILLLKTLLFRVEQVFLIHRKTGLLLQHVRAGPAHVEDAQLVSAMLTAIRDFVQDSFRVPEQDSLDALKVGELSIWIEQGPGAVLAAVIRGTAPPALRQVLQRALETVHLQHAEALEAFQGETDAFDATRPVLEECLATEYRPEAHRRRRGGLILIAALLLAAAIWGALAYRDYRRWNGYVQTLRNEPGLVVISTGRSHGKYAVAGLRDPLARDPRELLQQTQIDPDDVVGNWEPYHALLPGFVLPRANAILQPPSGVNLTLQDGVLHVAGNAPAAWIADARRVTPLIPGVNSFDASAAVDARIQSLTRSLEQSTLVFDRGSSRLRAGQVSWLGDIAALINELGLLAASTNRTLRIDVIGHTDADGSLDSNLPLSVTRATQAIVALGLQPSASLTISPSGVGSDDPIVAGVSEDDKQRNRRVAFRVSSERR
jgi:outer membrane protein OmpA-like peptidoglycan-associated protein